MKHVVYILGAGFSAPIDIPTIAGFRRKSLELKANGNVGYNNVLDKFEQLGTLKQRMNVELNNIEEVLSIMEVGDFVGGEADLNIVQEYIKNVITETTPKLKDDVLTRLKSSGQSWFDSIRYAGKDNNSSELIWWRYIYFVASLFELELHPIFNQQNNLENFKIQRKASNTKYTILSLNYDTVIEKCVVMLSSLGKSEDKVLDYNLIVSNGETKDKGSDVSLVKLHGCVSDTKTINTPTWNKYLSGSSSRKEWREAHDALLNATELRIIGYSLPVNDSYIQYFLKYCIWKNPDILRISVINKNDAETKQRYDNMFGANREVYQYLNFGTEDYLNRIVNTTHSHHETRIKDKTQKFTTPYLFQSLEKLHDVPIV
jgi:hypothetical protein